MGLLDGLAGQVLGAMSGGGQQGNLLNLVTSLLGQQQTGGLSGLVSMFEQQGLGNLIQSWIGTGQNLPISAEQLQSVLGSSQLQGLAEQFGLPHGEIVQQLAGYLPQIIDQLTPHGSLPQDNALGSLLGMLRG